MSKEYIKKTAHCFHTDEETVEKFIHDFFSSPDVNKALEVLNNFIEAHINSTTKEEVEDFLLFICDKEVSK